MRSQQQRGAQAACLHKPAASRRSRFNILDCNAAEALAIDSEPDYNDTAALPAGGGIWTYRAIYRVGDQLVGQQSKSVSIIVGG